MCNKYESVIRKPKWLKIKLQSSDRYSFVADIVSSHGLNTICGSGKCPNMAECWSKGTATFMILGSICTRCCKFCATTTGSPLPVENDEPRKIAESISLMKLSHSVITSVTRDDLPDYGASHWVEVVVRVKERNPDTTVELLIPDFNNKNELLDKIIASGADIIGHNIETVSRLTASVRSKATYENSLKVLRYLSDKGAKVKSGLMVGLGESDSEVIDTIKDLYEAGCRILTIGQYLQPTKKHLEVERYVTPQTFETYKEEALKIGFVHVESAPLVRSSYMAERAVEKYRLNLSDLGA